MQVFKHNKANKPLFTCCEADLKLETTLDQDGNYEIIMIPYKHLDEFSSFFADNSNAKRVRAAITNRRQAVKQKYSQKRQSQAEGNLSESVVPGGEPSKTGSN